MKMQIQQLKSIDKKVKSYLKKNKNASLKTLFKKFREDKNISSYGDIILFVHLAYLKTRITKKPFNRRQITNCLQLIEDYKELKRNEKSEIVSQVSECQKSGNMLPELG